MNKKAQGLSMNVIIITAIALLVLVILATFLLRSGGEISEGTSCSGMGGDCEYVDDGCQYAGDGEGTYVSAGQKDCDEDYICCIPLT